MIEQDELLMNTNPIAFEELIDFTPVYGVTPYDNMKEKIPYNARYLFGEWKCRSNKHTWISSIKYRSHQESDPGCPICKNQKEKMNPTLLAHRFHYSTNRTWVEGLWYCKNCYSFGWHKDTEDLEVYDYHNRMHCRPGLKTFAEKFPEIAEKWSTKNFVPANKILFNYENDFKFIWNCPDCGMEYKTSMYNAVYSDIPCPYCDKHLPLPEKSFAALYPQLAASWNYAVTQATSPNIGEFGERLPETVFPDNRSFGYFTCPDCGVTREMYIGDLIEEEKCPYCTSGMTKEYSEKLYKGFRVKPNEYFEPELKQYTYFVCPDCEQRINMKPIEAFRKKQFCKYCSGNLAIPGKTSVYALYTNLIKTEWIYQNNILSVDPRMELPTSTKKAWWKCMYCGKSYKMSIKERIRDYLRTRNSCTYCNGFTRVKFRN